MNSLKWDCTGGLTIVKPQKTWFYDGTVPFINLYGNQKGYNGDRTQGPYDCNSTTLYGLAERRLKEITSP